MEENQVPESGLTTDESPAQEKMLTQSQVNKIVASEKTRAAESARREAEDKHQRELQALQDQRARQEQRNEEVPRDVDIDSMSQKVLEKLNKDLQQQRFTEEVNRVTQTYLSKVEQGKSAYDDFEAITQDFDPSAFPQLTILLSGIDNMADVLYDLAKNPLKLSGLDRLAEKNPRQAHNELLKLSKSILDNRQALSDAENQDVAAPLDRLQPSRVSGSNGKMGIQDLRAQPWLRG